METKVFEQLLYLYDWHIRNIGKDRDPYQCGYADAIAQVILDLGKIYNEDVVKFSNIKNADYKFEAYKRVMQFTTVEKYKRDYPHKVERPVIHP